MRHARTWYDSCSDSGAVPNTSPKSSLCLALFRWDGVPQKSPLRPREQDHGEAIDFATGERWVAGMVCATEGDSGNAGHCVPTQASRSLRRRVLLP